MADIHLERKHQLGLAAARKIAFEWAEQAENEFDMACTYEEGKTCDTVSFKRSGVHGTLDVTAEHFALSAKLGLLMSAYANGGFDAVVASKSEKQQRGKVHGQADKPGG